MADTTYNFMNESATVNPQGQVISLNQLKPETPITVPTPPPPPVPSIAGVDTTQKSLSDYIASLTPPTTQADNAQQTLLNSIAELSNQGAGKQQALAQEQINQGVPTLTKDLQDLNNQILTGSAEYKQLQAEGQQQFESAGGVGGAVVSNPVLQAQQAGLQRSNAAKLSAKAADLGLIRVVKNLLLPA